MSKPDRARAIADVTSGSILATVDIAASPERVFRALTTPEEVVRWWGSKDLYRTTKWEQELRVHGRWRAEGLGADGVPFSVQGEFLEIDPPRKLVQTWQPEWDGGHSTTVTYRLEASERGTRVTIRHDGFGSLHDSCRRHAAGWEHVLDWLSGFSAPAPAADSFFLCRLLPPRPSFVMDMSADERSLMQSHAGHWMQHMQAGRVIVFGPVGDPQGPWGLGVVRAADLGEVQAFTDRDPVIRAACGFRYEILPMLSALMP